MRSARFGIVFLVAGVLEMGAPSWVVASDVWAEKAPMPTARHGMHAAVLDGQVYVAGGAIPGTNSNLTANEVYDPATDSWASRAAMPTARRHAAVAAADGSVFVIGGYNGTTWIGTNERYDPVTDSWSTRAPMPTARTADAFAVVDSKIYVIGGHSGFWRDTVEQYDPASDQWTPRAPMPTPRSGISAAVVDGRIYVVGGDDPSQLATVEVYDPSTDSWSAVTSMPTPRTALAAAAANGKVFALGGWQGSDLAVNEEYDPAGDTWTSRAPMPGAQHGITAASVGDRIYVFGGQFSSPGDLTWEYTPAGQPALASREQHGPPLLKITAACEGSWANGTTTDGVFVVLLPATSGRASRYRIAVVFTPPETGVKQIVEDWDELSVDPYDPKYLKATLRFSRYIRWDPYTPPVVPWALDGGHGLTPEEILALAAPAHGTALSGGTGSGTGPCAPSDWASFEVEAVVQQVSWDGTGCPAPEAFDVSPGDTVAAWFGFDPSRQDEDPADPTVGIYGFAENTGDFVMAASFFSLGGSYVGAAEGTLGQGLEVWDNHEDLGSATDRLRVHADALVHGAGVFTREGDLLLDLETTLNLESLTTDSLPRSLPDVTHFEAASSLTLSAFIEPACDLSVESQVTLLAGLFSSGGSVIGGGGGEFETGDGGMKVVIPPGALTEITEITVTDIHFNDPAADLALAAGNGKGQRLRVYDLQPDGLVFDTPIEVTLVFDLLTAQPPLNELQRSALAVYLETDTGELAPVGPIEGYPAPGCTIEMDIATCTAWILHFSTYALIAPLDTDGDGVFDLFGGQADNCPQDDNAGQENQDGDESGDVCDPDADGDGDPALSDCDDLDPTRYAGALEICTDGVDNDCDGDVDEIEEAEDCDGDGVPHELDNCPRDFNEFQEDLDNDGLGDACDDDLDGDTVPNESDNCPVEANPNQEDLDGDGTGDLCDADADGDGLLDATEDLCLGTRRDPDSGVPSRGLGKNRWAEMDGNIQFDTRGENPTGRMYSYYTTGGCNCAQIIEICGYGQGHVKFGCSNGVMDWWTGFYDRDGEAPFQCQE